MRKNSKLIVWIGWSVIWILMNKILATNGIIAPRTMLSLIIECLISIVAAEIMCISIPITITMFIYLAVRLFKNFNAVGIACFVLSIGLYLVTLLLTPKKAKKKKAKTATTRPEPTPTRNRFDNLDDDFDDDDFWAPRKD